MEAIWVQRTAKNPWFEVAVERNGALYYVQIIVSPKGQRTAYRCIREAGVNQTPKTIRRDIEAVAKAALLFDDV